MRDLKERGTFCRGDLGHFVDPIINGGVTDLAEIQEALMDHGMLIEDLALSGTLIPTSKKRAIEYRDEILELASDPDRIFGLVAKRFGFSR